MIHQNQNIWCRCKNQQLMIRGDIVALEWYLLKPPYSQTSGFEEDSMDYSRDAFFEALDSPIAIDVEYCNADLSVCTPIKAIVQNSVADTKLNAFNRHLLVQVGTCKAGYYIKPLNVHRVLNYI